MSLGGGKMATVGAVVEDGKVVSGRESFERPMEPYTYSHHTVNCLLITIYLPCPQLARQPP